MFVSARPAVASQHAARPNSATSLVLDPSIVAGSRLSSSEMRRRPLLGGSASTSPRQQQQQQQQQRALPAASPAPTAGSTTAGAVAPPAGPALEIVWHGARPRLLRKLQMSHAAPEPDFRSASFSSATVGASAAASSRAVSTARRLKLPPYPAAYSAAAAAAAALSGGDVGGAPAPPAGATAQPQPTQQRRLPAAATTADEHTWLAPDDQDFLEALAVRRRELARASYRGSARDAARVATAPLAAIWHDAGMNRGASLSEFNKLAPSVPIERVLLDKLGPAPTEDAGGRVVQHGAPFS